MDNKTNEIRSFNVSISLQDALLEGNVIDLSNKETTIGNSIYHLLKTPIKVLYENKTSTYLVISIVKDGTNSWCVLCQDNNRHITRIDASKLFLSLEVVLKSNISHLKYSEQTKLKFDGEER